MIKQYHTKELYLGVTTWDSELQFTHASLDQVPRYM